MVRLSDQLGNVLVSLRKYFGRPSLTLGDLIDTGHISMAELAPHCHKNVPLRPTTFVYPCVTGVAYGPITAHFSLLRIACLRFVERQCITSEKCLSVSLPLPWCVSESFGLASDDNYHFTIRGMEHAEEVGKRIDRAFRRPHIRSDPTKRITGALDDTCIGLDLFKGALLFGPAGTTGSEVQGPLETTQHERFDDALGLKSQARR